MITNTLVFLALLKVSEYYKASVCATLWALIRLTGGFTDFFGPKRSIWYHLGATALGFVVAYVVFKYIREARSDWSKWVFTVLIGAALLAFMP